MENIVIGRFYLLMIKTDRKKERRESTTAFEQKRYGYGEKEVAMGTKVSTSVHRTPSGFCERRSLSESSTNYVIIPSTSRIFPNGPFSRQPHKKRGNQEHQRSRVIEPRIKMAHATINCARTRVGAKERVNENENNRMTLLLSIYIRT